MNHLYLHSVPLLVVAPALRACPQTLRGLQVHLPQAIPGHRHGSFICQIYGHLKRTIGWFTGIVAMGLGNQERDVPRLFLACLEHRLRESAGLIFRGFSVIADIDFFA